MNKYTYPSPLQWFSCVSVVWVSSSVCPPSSTLVRRRPSTATQNLLNRISRFLRGPIAVTHVCIHVVSQFGPSAPTISPYALLMTISPPLAEANRRAVLVRGQDSDRNIPFLSYKDQRVHPSLHAPWTTRYRWCFFNPGTEVVHIYIWIQSYETLKPSPKPINPNSFHKSIKP
jgi:hypothetical protein